MAFFELLLLVKIIFEFFLYLYEIIEYFFRNSKDLINNLMNYIIILITLYLLPIILIFLIISFMISFGLFQ